MYHALKTIISTGDYKLAELQSKVKKLYVMGDLTEEQMDELFAMASKGVSADAERPETLELIRSLASEIHTLKNRVKALEGGNGESGEHTGYPQWKSWDGISGDYQNGAIVSHNGKLWKSVFNEQNVWEPGTTGTETLWVEYTSEE